MEITEVKVDHGARVPVRVNLADMDGVTMRQYSRAKFDLQPFAVEVVWPLPYRPGIQPDSVKALGSRVLKSGALGVSSEVRFYDSDEWPSWLQSAVEAARLIAWNVQVAGDGE